MIFIYTIIFPIIATFLASFTYIGKRFSGLIFVIASLPSIWLGLGSIEISAFRIDWLILGTEFSIDTTRRIILLLSGFLWASSGLFAGSYLKNDPRKSQFNFYFGASMTGNFGLLIAGDVITFYTFFALMTFASYGLIVHTRGLPALKAGKIYLIMAIMGELFILTSIFLAVDASGSILLKNIPQALAGSSNGSFIFWLALIGFGVKVGAIPLYFWLPLAHPAAPVPASAVLSGAMIKAGLVGWIHFAPIGLVHWHSLSLTLIILGFLAALGAAVIGLFQVDPKTNLAYSSISQMGIMTAFLGIGLYEGLPANVLLPAIALYAYNHGTAKAILFLGVALPSKISGHLRIVMWIGLGYGVLSIAGGPFSGGLWTKYLFKTFLDQSGVPGVGIISTLLILSTITTSILLIRFLHLLSKISATEVDGFPFMILPWLFLLIAGGLWTISPLLLTEDLRDHITQEINIAFLFWNPYYIWNSILPIFLGIGIYVVVFILYKRLAGSKNESNRNPIVPPGDLIHIIILFFDKFNTIFQKRIAILQSHFQNKITIEIFMYRLIDDKKTIQVSDDIETYLRRWDVVGIAFFIFFIALFLFLR
ncbi:MAG: hypothetical protein JJT78_04565 [Leptospira sp.]|nr:hypothetical protein [Leptospira sp.]